MTWPPHLSLSPPLCHPSVPDRKAAQLPAAMAGKHPTNLCVGNLIPQWNSIGKWDLIRGSWIRVIIEKGIQGQWFKKKKKKNSAFKLFLWCVHVLPSSSPFCHVMTHGKDPHRCLCLVLGLHSLQNSQFITRSVELCYSNRMKTMIPANLLFQHKCPSMEVSQVS